MYLLRGIHLMTITLLAMTSQLTLANTKIYQWVDKDGQTHYSDAPQGKVSGVKTTDDDPTTIDPPKTNAKPTKIPKPSPSVEPAKE